MNLIIWIIIHNSDMQEVIIIKHSVCRIMHSRGNGLASGNLTMKFLLLLRLYIPDIEFKNTEWKEVSHIVYTI